MLDGLGYGENAKAGLITRGLAEITRLGLQLGARRDTFFGLAGVGDLIATCMSPLSRNHAAGVALAHGKSMSEILAGTPMVIEGIHTAPWYGNWHGNTIQICPSLDLSRRFCSMVNK